MASVIRMATRAAASTALRRSKLVNLQRLQLIETLNPKIFVNGMYSAHFHASNFCLSNAVPNVRISERTLEVSGAEGKDEDHKSQGQNTPIEEATVRKLAKRNEIKQQLEETRNEICKIVENAEKSMEEALTLMGTRLTSELVTMVLSSLNSLQLALRFFQWAKAQPGFKPNSAMYDELVNIAVRCKDFEALKMLLTERVADTCFNSAKTFSFATAWHDDAEMLGKVTETIKQLKNLAQKNAYDMMVFALCKEDYVDSATSVLKDMYKAGCALTPLTFRPLLVAHGRNNRMVEVHEVFKFMNEMGCPPDVTCYNFVLRKLHQNEQFAEADKFFKMMVNTFGCKPDHVTYDILVLEACRAGKMEDATRHFGRMKEDGLKPLHCTYTNLINGFFQLDGFEKAYAFVRQESGKNDSLDVNNYSFLIRTCTKLGNYREAHDVLMEMKAKNLKTDHRLCNDVLEKIC